LDPEILLRKLAREKSSRKEAERILEEKAYDLFNANKALSDLNKNLQQEIERRTLELATSEEKYRQLVETAGDIIYQTDQFGTFTYINATAIEKFGYNESAFIDESFLKFVREDYQEEVGAFYWKMLQTAISESYNEFPVLAEDGKSVWIGQNVRRREDEEGVVTFNAMARDITSRKKAEFAAEKLREELERSKFIAEEARNAETQFLANMSHEIRTPINAIIGMLHLLDDTSLTEEQDEYVKILLSSSKLLQSLISDVLDLSKIDSGSMELNLKPCKIGSLVMSLMNTFQTKEESKDLAYMWQIDNNLAHSYELDPLFLNQVLINLVGNASKFTEQGEIRVDLKLMKEGPDKDVIRFEVTDTGIGISQEDQNLIFEEFKQSHNDMREKFGGTGLGLAISKKLVGKMGGTLQVKSEVGKGSQFFFELEAKKLETSKIAAMATNDQNTSEEFRTDYPILIAEDNLINQTYISRLMQKWDIEHEMANNGVEAVEMGKNKTYGLIFMDIQMPEMDGITATKEIRKEGMNVNSIIIALTASPLLSKMQESMSAGMNDFLSKPFNPTQLKDMMMKHQNAIGNANEIVEEDMSEFSFATDFDAETLSMYFGEDLEYAYTVFDLLVETMPADIEAANQAFESQDGEELAKIMHKIAPSMQMIGLNQLYTNLQAVENLLKESKFSEGFEKYSLTKIQLDKAYVLITNERQRLLVFNKS